MAGRFVFQKFSSVMSTSTSLLSSHVPAARAGAAVTRIAPDCGTRNLSNVLQGAALRPGTTSPNSHGIHVLAARSPCSLPAAAETSWLRTGMPSIMNRTAPTFVDSITGMKRGLSFMPEPSEKAKIAARQGKYKIKQPHDSTPSMIVNSFATMVMGAFLFRMIDDE